MPDYKAMYFKLFNQISKTIEELQKIQQQTEEMYIQGPEAEFLIFKNDDESD